MKLFDTEKKESSRSRWMRRIFNVWPCIFCTGSRVEFIAGDYHELHVSLRLNWRTRNRVGTVFGGSIYSSIDPYYMLLLMEILGKNYVVWDKAGSVKFIRPIKGKVKCRFLLLPSLVAELKQQVNTQKEYVFSLPLQFEDDAGKVFATFTKTLYVADKEFYKQKLAERKR